MGIGGGMSGDGEGMVRVGFVTLKKWPNGKRKKTDYNLFF